MDDKDKTSYKHFCQGSECPEIKKLKIKIDKIYTRLDLIIGGIITVLLTIIGGLIA